MPGRHDREPNSHNTNVYCLQCHARIGIVQNQWRRLTSSYAKPILPVVSFDTEISERTQVVPSGSVQKAAEGCVMAEVLCQCSAMVGQYCVSGNHELVGKQYFKMSRIFLKDSRSLQNVNPAYAEDEQGKAMPNSLGQKPKPPGRSRNEDGDQVVPSNRRFVQTSELEDEPMHNSVRSLQYGSKSQSHDAGQRGNDSLAHERQMDNGQNHNSIVKKQGTTLNKTVERLTGLERRVNDHSTRLTGMDMRILRSEDASQSHHDLLSEHTKILKRLQSPDANHAAVIAEVNSPAMSRSHTQYAVHDRASETPRESQELDMYEVLLERQQKQIQELTGELRAAQRSISSIKKKLEASRVALFRRVTPADVTTQISRALLDLGETLAGGRQAFAESGIVGDGDEQDILQLIAAVMLQSARKGHRQVPQTLGKRRRDTQAEERDSHEADDSRPATNVHAEEPASRNMEATPNLEEHEGDNDERDENAAVDRIPPLDKRTKSPTPKQKEADISAAEAIDFSDDDGIADVSLIESRTTGQLLATRIRSLPAVQKSIIGRSIDRTSTPSGVKPITQNLDRTQSRSTKRFARRRSTILTEYERSTETLPSVSCSDDNSSGDDSELVRTVTAARTKEYRKKQSLPFVGTSAKNSHPLNGIYEAAALGDLPVRDNVTIMRQGDKFKSRKDESNGQGGRIARQDKRQKRNEDMCAACGFGGTLLCCDSCPKVYHRRCLTAESGSRADQSGDWHCPECEGNT